MALGALGNEQLDTLAAEVAAGERTFSAAFVQILEAIDLLGGGDGI